MASGLLYIFFSSLYLSRWTVTTTNYIRQLFKMRPNEKVNIQVTVQVLLSDGSVVFLYVHFEIGKTGETRLYELRPTPASSSLTPVISSHCIPWWSINSLCLGICLKRFPHFKLSALFFFLNPNDNLVRAVCAQRWKLLKEHNVSYPKSLNLIHTQTHQKTAHPTWTNMTQSAMYNDKYIVALNNTQLNNTPNPSTPTQPNNKQRL